MSESESSRLAAKYAVVWTVAAVVGAVLAGVGVWMWVLPAWAGLLDGDPTAVVARTAAPGLALVVLGLLVWKVTAAVVLYRTLSAAFAAETAERLDTETMKSDILSVMDERLAEINRDTQQTRRIVERMGSEEAADEFEFPDGR